MATTGRGGLKLKVGNAPAPELAFTNAVFVNAEDAPALTLEVQAVALPLQTYVAIREHIFVFQANEKIPRGTVGLSSIQRRNLQLALNDVVDAVPFNPTDERIFLSSISLEVDLLTKPRAVAAPANGSKAPAAPPPPTFSAPQMAAQVERSFTKHVFTVGQNFLLNINDINLTFHVRAIETTDLKWMMDGANATAPPPAATPDSATTTAPGDAPSRGVLLKNTSIKIEKAAGAALRLTDTTGGGSGVGLFKTKNLTPELLGIGGLDKEFYEVVRRTLVSRVFPNSLMKKLGQPHNKGIILYGPPGTGKTLMARTIGKMLNGKEPKVVAGPELFNKYVGQTEENIRNLFKEAIDEYEQRQEDSELHVIVLDEIDALCKVRGSRGDGTGVGDSAVNQLLAMIDGVNALNNVLIIGMTNRIDMIDEALLRPGRLEVRIEVGLPDQNGRLQILRIHTASMRNAGFLAKDVNLEELAVETKNFTGAEIQGLVKSAVSFALNSKVDFQNLQDVSGDDIQITRDHFAHALTEVHPSFGIDEQDFTRCFSNGVVVYGSAFQRVVNTVNTLISQVRESTRTPLVSCLISGRVGSGKTALATKLAMGSGFPFVKMISPEDLVLVGTESGRCNRIVQAFEDAYKSALSIVIIDDIERLLDYVPLGPRFSNTILQTLLVLVKKPPEKAGRKLLIIGTTSNPQVLRDMELYDAFNAVVEIPPVCGPDELRTVLASLGTGADALSPEVIEGACQAFPHGAEIPVKKLIMLVEMARQYRDPLIQGGLVDALSSIAAASSLGSSMAGASSALAVAVAAAKGLKADATPGIAASPNVQELPR